MASLRPNSSNPTLPHSVTRTLPTTNVQAVATSAPVGPPPPPPHSLPQSNSQSHIHNAPSKFPILYRIARCFTCAGFCGSLRTRLFLKQRHHHPEPRKSLSLMSALQLLKFSYRTRRLDFTSDWIATEEEFRIDNVTPELVEELMNAGKFSELEELLVTSATPCEGALSVL